MSQHTPGPWAIDNGEIVAGWKVLGMVYGADDYPCEEDDIEAECDANARLIAAAPDLLAACVDALQFVQNGVAFGYIHLPDSPDRAATFEARIEAAIAKAKGESP